MNVALPDPKMTRREIVKEDGRKLYFYSFGRTPTSHVDQTPAPEASREEPYSSADEAATDV